MPDRFDKDGRPLDRDGNSYEPGSKRRGWRANVAWLKGDLRNGFRGGARSFGDGPKSSMDYDDRRSRSSNRDDRQITRGNNRDRDRDREEDEGEGKGGQEMVEKFARDFGDVFEGRKTWKDLLMGFVEEAGSLSALGGGGSRESLGDEKGRGSGSGSGKRRRRDTDRY